MSFIIINKINGGHALYVNGFHMPSFVVNNQSTLTIQKWLDHGKVSIYSEHEYGNIITPLKQNTQTEAENEADDIINELLSLIDSGSDKG